VLERDPVETARTLETGQIRTHSDYGSNWYGFDRIEGWVRELWCEPCHHLHTRSLDALRAEPAQMAILDPGDHTRSLLKSWGVMV
jgi:hypothetical protein